MKNKEVLLPASEINVLSEGIANRIAAGEVVERPASVIKELVENSLDAQASRLEISVRNAGFDEIVVSDNGWGMDDKDLSLAFRRHATSKIKTAKDLQRIMNLGFRGEALPSVASVARVEVISRREDRESAFVFKVEGGKENPIQPAARERGTSVKVRSLFYNVPARRKFLRTPSTEYNHILNMFKRYALAYPELSWTLNRDNSCVHQLESTDLNGRISQIMGNEAGENLHPVNVVNRDVSITGVVGGESLFRKSRGDQYLFINRRPFFSTSLNHAVINGYGQMIQSREIPFYVLFLRANPEDFDVNVHPAKHDVRFRDESLMYKTVLIGVREALGTSIREGNAPVVVQSGNLSSQRKRFTALPPKPTARKIDGKKEMEMLFGKTEKSIDENSRQEILPKGTSYSEPLNRGILNNNSKDTSSINSNIKENDIHLSKVSSNITTHPIPDEPLCPENSREEKFSEISSEGIQFWQLHNTYIFSQVKSGLAIIDQHVAHERILYEKAISSMQEKPWNGQRVLFPVEVELNSSDSELLEELKPGLLRMGMEVEALNEKTWRILSVPAGIDISNEAKLLRDIISDYRNEFNIKLEPEENLAASFACKAAIKKGQSLSQIEMKTLIEDLFKTRYPFVCPHGRPVVVNMTISELNKLFGRE